MANKKNKKKSSGKKKKVLNTADTNKAVQYALQNNIDRIAGSILAGKDLNPPTKVAHPCVICNSNVLDNQNGVECTNCWKWCHRKCDGMNVSMYNYLNENPELEWHCLYCTMTFNHDHIPFTLSDNFDLNNVNQSDNEIL